MFSACYSRISLQQLRICVALLPEKVFNNTHAATYIVMWVNGSATSTHLHNKGSYLQWDLEREFYMIPIRVHVEPMHFIVGNDLLIDDDMQPRPPNAFVVRLSENNSWLIFGYSLHGSRMAAVDCRF
jgi:hypothetical protein